MAMAVSISKRRLVTLAVAVGLILAQAVCGQRSAAPLIPRTALACPPSPRCWPATDIDPFDAYQAILQTYDDGDPQNSVVDDSSILGGERDIKVEKTGGKLFRSVKAVVSDGELAHSQDRDSYGYTLVSWDGDDDDAETLAYALNADLTAGGADRFYLGLNTADHSGANLIVTVYTDAAQWSVLAKTVSATAEPQVYTFVFTDFVAGTGASGPADFANVGAITLEVDGRSVNNLDLSLEFFATQIPNGAGTGTPGYWKNHPECWPADRVLLGNVSYSKAEAIAILKSRTKGDKSYTLAKAYIAAKLNTLIGNDSSCVDETLNAANAWFVEHPVGSGVSADSPAWEQGEVYKDILDDYNNGLLCAPAREAFSRSRGWRVKRGFAPAGRRFAHRSLD
jgi:hypothetical protein